MTHFTGYLLGKVQLDGAIRSEVLASLVETLIQRYQSSEPNKKNLKFNEANNKYAVECSERGLKLTSPGVKARDEGFESDCDSIRSVKLNDAAELNLADLIDHLEISKDEKEPPSLSSGTSMDNTSISSSTNLQASDDNNSTSGNGSDSDEFCNFAERSPHWETLPNVSSFQSYPIEDLVFCHCDSLHPSTLVWVVRHLAKMMALVTSFRTRSEAEELFQTYRELRMKVKPVKYQKMNVILGATNSKLIIPPVPKNSAVQEITVPQALPPPTPQPPQMVVSNYGHSQSYSSLPIAYLTEVLHETQSKNPLFSKPSKFGDFVFKPSVSSSEKEESPKYGSTRALSNVFPERQPFQFMTWGAPKTGDSTTTSSLRREVVLTDRIDPAEEITSDGEIVSVPVPAPVKKIPPPRPVRKIAAPGKVSRPVLLVPLKTESVSTPRSNYPKESYLYHVMGRTSSTFAPYQRSLNYLPQYSATNKNNNGTEYLAWANGNGKQQLVPFSSWLELSEINKGTSSQSSQNHLVHFTKTRQSSRNGIGRSSALANLTGKGTAKILLRDSAGNHHSMWATLSQRFKRNFRDTLMPKLNGIWVQNGDGGHPKKKSNKKVTFNAWATVQMV